jgi:hypothetical protein
MKTMIFDVVETGTFPRPRASFHCDNEPLSLAISLYFRLIFILSVWQAEALPVSASRFLGGETNSNWFKNAYYFLHDVLNTAKVSAFPAVFFCNFCN